MDQDINPTPKKVKTDKNKKNKLLFWSIIVGAVVIVAAVVVLIVILLGNGSKPQKQAYQSILDTTNGLQETQDGPDARSTAVSRQLFEIGLKNTTHSRIDDDTLKKTNFRAVHTSGEMTPHLLVDEKSLKEVEEKERSTAKKIEDAYKILDNLVADLNDQDVQASYKIYQDQRDKIGMGVKSTEQNIQMLRIYYGCAGAMSTMDKMGNSPHAAKEFTMWAEACLASTKQALKSDKLDSEQHKIVTRLGDYMNDSVETILPFIEKNRFGAEGTAAFDKLKNKYKDVDNPATKEPAATNKDLEETIENFRTVVIEKRDKAPGNYAPTSTDPSGNDSSRGVAAPRF